MNVMTESGDITDAKSPGSVDFMQASPFLKLLLVPLNCALPYVECEVTLWGQAAKHLSFSEEGKPPLLEGKSYDFFNLIPMQSSCISNGKYHTKRISLKGTSHISWRLRSEEVGQNYYVPRDTVSTNLLCKLRLGSEVSFTNKPKCGTCMN
jgi:hypothetical protein